MSKGRESLPAFSFTYQFLQSSRTMEWHDAIQQNHKVNILRIQDIFIKSNLLQKIVENRIVQDGIAWQPRIKRPILITVIIEIKVTAPLFSLGVSAGDTEAVQKKTRKNAMPWLAACCKTDKKYITTGFGYRTGLEI